jgi:hypothetical protein
MGKAMGNPLFKVIVPMATTAIQVNVKPLDCRVLTHSLARLSSCYSSTAGTLAHGSNLCRQGGWCLLDACFNGRLNRHSHESGLPALIFNQKDLK